MIVIVAGKSIKGAVTITIPNDAAELEQQSSVASSPAP